MAVGAAKAAATAMAAVTAGNFSVSKGIKIGGDGRVPPIFLTAFRLPHVLIER